MDSGIAAIGQPLFFNSPDYKEYEDYLYCRTLRKKRPAFDIDNPNPPIKHQQPNADFSDLLKKPIVSNKAKPAEFSGEKEISCEDCL